ncbi:MAG: ATP-binding protein [bacterium]
MLEDFEVHNQFRESVVRYRNHDPHLKKLTLAPLVYYSTLLQEKNFNLPGIFVITGGRQVGKTTFLKQLILRLLEQKKVSPESILFLSGELIDSHHKLRLIINQFSEQMQKHLYLFVDEVNYIPDWDKSLKFLADSGTFEYMSIFLTGSDTSIIKAAMKRFPGRRGAASVVDYSYNPLSFTEFVCLKDKKLYAACHDIIEKPLLSTVSEYEKYHGRLLVLLNEYLIHGGYLPAITEFEKHKVISRSVTNTYIQWIVGDMLKHNKDEHYVWEILRGIKKTYLNGISWNTLGKSLSIEHHKTVADYCYLLESAHVIHIQEMLVEHKLVGGPKKNRKIYFRDPFIDHAVTVHLNPSVTTTDIQKKLSDNLFLSSYIEAIIVDHCKRRFPTYYIRGNKGEVDVAVVIGDEFFPIEVKWTNTMRSEELKQIQQYKKGIILSKGAEQKKMGNNTIIPLLRFLLYIDHGVFEY